MTWGWGSSTKQWEYALGLCALQVEEGKRWFLSSDFTPWLASRLDVGEGDPIWDRRCAYSSQLALVCFSIPISAHICYLEVAEVPCEALETPTPCPWRG